MWMLVHKKEKGNTINYDYKEFHMDLKTTNLPLALVFKIVGQTAKYFIDWQ